jgi:hypothetical protein
MVFNATFSNISITLWRSVLLVEYQEKTTDLSADEYHFLYNIVVGIVHINCYNQSKKEKNCSKTRLFLLQPSISVQCINPQAYSGLFEISLPIFDGDTKAKVLNRLVKTDRSKMKGMLKN